VEADLITECFLSLASRDSEWSHPNQQNATEIARRTMEKRMTLTHFDARKVHTIQKQLDAVKDITNSAM
jgi:hypothetical protein